MRIDTLEDLYIEQLKDVFSANKQALDVTIEMAKIATDPGLAQALDAGAKGIREGIETLKDLAIGHDESPDGAHCKGMEGLAQEANAQAIEERFGEAATKDAMIITQYQKMVHYAIAGYGCLAAFADRLELDGDVTALKVCLDAAYSGDRTMTGLATGRINHVATA